MYVSNKLIAKCLFMAMYMKLTQNSGPFRNILSLFWWDVYAECNLARQKEEDRDFIVSMQPQNSAGNWLHDCCEKRRIVSGMQHAENHIKIIGFWHESSCITASLVTLRYYYVYTAWLFFFLSLDWYPACSGVNIWLNESMCGQPRQLNLIVLIEVKRPSLLLHTGLWMWWSNPLQNITWMCVLSPRNCYTGFQYESMTLDSNMNPWKENSHPRS